MNTEQLTDQERKLIERINREMEAQFRRKDLEHTAIERLKAASEMSLQAYGLPLDRPEEV